MPIFYHSKIYAPEFPDATAMVVHKDRIIALGSDTALLEAYSSQMKSFNMNGRTIWPGLTDAHVHLEHLASSLTSIDCETDTLQECLNRVRTAARNAPEGSWILGHGWNHNLWAQGYGNAKQLDQAAGNHPVYLTAKSLHAAWANHPALRLAGINQSSLDPADGTIQRDSTGHPTGILFENAMNLISNIIPKPSPQALSEQILKLLPRLWSVGLIGVHDFDSFNCWEALQILHQQKSLRFRIRKNIPFDHMDAFINAGLKTDYGDDWLNIGGVKLFADGALGPMTGAMLEPYQNSKETGTLLLSEKEILEIGKRAVSHGLALTIHAIGDLANRIVLDAFAKIREYETNHNLPHLKHRIEHVQTLHPNDVSRFQDLDIIASVQPIHAPSDMQTADLRLGERTKHAYAYQTLAKHGAFLVLGSDSPVESFNPFQGIHAAVTRRRLNGDPGPDGWHPNERLSLHQAVDGFSINPAAISGRGSHLGKLGPGYQADFLILEDDPATIDTHQIGRIQPTATYINGKCVYQNPKVDLFS